ncbi:cytochrome c550 [Siminovitchia sp. FSL H7-0308]|uniref:Cytochrome c550 n=1 Tax=Siminovitchia thermophila TaxID=1245522 RepID=A0ABS2R9H6_9BACI|nr:cytochrome c [Siminovitchia thermophila]MBM7716286.1 cytochrome c550 [Siminovitchia thermophila]ONK24219.1 cytochrome C [Bacillus sp. VT-16-64]
MKRNPLVPYYLIMALGLVLVFFLGIKGLGDAKEIAKEKEGGGKEEVAAEFEPEEYANKACISCHGENLEGGSAPTLHGTGLSKEEVADILANGRGAMPPGLVPAENIEEMAEWVANLK